MDISLLDTTGARVRVDRTAAELRRLALETRRCAAVAWESSAAETFRERVGQQADRVETLARQVGELAGALRDLEAAARERAALVEDLAGDIWSGLRL